MIKELLFSKNKKLAEQVRGYQDEISQLKSKLFRIILNRKIDIYELS